MRLVFAGTPAFAAASLRALVEAGYDIALVLTRPDRPAGRGMKLAASEVKQLALATGVEVYQPATLRDPAAQIRIRQAAADAMVVAAYGLILPPAVLEAMPAGCINVHASLLPRWRGAAPIQRALLAGDAETGISIMRMEEGLDTGPVYLMHRQPIAADETAGGLHDKLASLGGRAIVEALSAIAGGTLRPRAQASAGVTYAAKITKEEAALDWSADARTLERQIRAFNPFPGAHSRLGAETLKIWRAAIAQGEGAAGTILHAAGDHIVVACGRGALRLEQLQRAGGKRMDAADFLHGSGLAAGARLGA
jgi:methionyl-tRNA formyltransferase